MTVFSDDGYKGDARTYPLAMTEKILRESIRLTDCDTVSVPG